MRRGEMRVRERMLRRARAGNRGVKVSRLFVGALESACDCGRGCESGSGNGRRGERGDVEPWKRSVGGNPGILKCPQFSMRSGTCAILILRIGHREVSTAGDKIDQCRVLRDVIPPTPPG